MDFNVGFCHFPVTVQKKNGKSHHAEGNKHAWSVTCGRPLWAQKKDKEGVLRDRRKVEKMLM